MNRRSVLKYLSLTPLALSANGMVNTLSTKDNYPQQLKNNIHQTVCRWCFDDISIEKLCQYANQWGIKAIDLVEPKDFSVLKKYGIHSSMCTGAYITLEKGFNNPIYHDELEKRYLKHIDLVADAGYKNLICFSGNRNGMSDADGLKNSVIGLRRILPYAEKREVVIQMELFNSKVNHPDYMADSSKWGIDLCKELASPNFKLLYDIYHMQIMEGDIIATIEKYHTYFGHYHTAGVPGRHEIGTDQELYYPAIMQAIHKTGFTGYVGQEFIPISKDKFNAFQQAINLCDI